VVAKEKVVHSYVALPFQCNFWHGQLASFFRESIDHATIRGGIALATQSMAGRQAWAGLCWRLYLNPYMTTELPGFLSPTKISSQAGCTGSIAGAELLRIDGAKSGPLLVCE
jgi:hypothetical protein